MLLQGQEQIIVIAVWVIVLITGIFFAMVIGSKSRRDYRERRSAEYKARLLVEIHALDIPRLTRSFTELAHASNRTRADLIAVLAQLPSHDWWTGEYNHIIRTAADESGFMHQLHKNLSSLNAVTRGTAVVIGGFPCTQVPAEYVTQLLSDEEPTVRLAAAATLESIGTPEATRALIFALEQQYIPDGRVVERLDHDWAVATILEHLTNTDADTDERVRCALMRALSAVGDTRTIPAMNKFLTHGTDEERIQATKTLASCLANCTELQRGEILKHLRNALSDTSPRVRASAVHALSRAGEPEDVDLVVPLLSDPDWFVRRQAAQTLTTLGTPGIIALKNIASGNDTFAADRAREQLELIGALQPSDSRAMKAEEN